MFFRIWQGVYRRWSDKEKKNFWLIVISLIVIMISTLARYKNLGRLLILVIESGTGKPLTK